MVFGVGPGTTATHALFFALCSAGLPTAHWDNTCIPVWDELAQTWDYKYVFRNTPTSLFNFNFFSPFNTLYACLFSFKEEGNGIYTYICIRISVAVKNDNSQPSITLLLYDKKICIYIYVCVCISLSWLQSTETRKARE